MLARKPGALAGSRSLEQERRAGLWPRTFDAIWQKMMTRDSKHAGTKHVISLLKLCRQFGREQVQAAIEIALETGCTAIAAVEHLVPAHSLHRPVYEALKIGSLEPHQRLLR